MGQHLRRQDIPCGFGLNTQYLGWASCFLTWTNDGWPTAAGPMGHVYPEVDSQHLGSNFKEPKILYQTTATERS